jgi:hypothetical protein
MEFLQQQGETSKPPDQIAKMLPPRRPTRSVRFDIHSTQIHSVDSDGDDHQAGSSSRLWYDWEDYEFMKVQDDGAVRMMLSDQNDLEAFGHCYRGLECRRQSVMNQRDDNTYRALEAVLTEQKRQERSKIEDSELLATVYEGYTQICREDALQRGRSDARVATCVLRKSLPACNEKEERFIEFDAEEEDDDISLLSDDGTKAKIIQKVVRRLMKMMKR